MRGRDIGSVRGSDQVTAARMMPVAMPMAPKRMPTAHIQNRNQSGSSEIRGE